MNSADALLTGLASGDTAPEPLAPLAAPKRDHDSPDDFEHLERAGSASPQHARVSSQAFLDMERSSPVHEAAPPLPASPARLQDQLADKFTDSESEAESPQHRPATSAPAAAQPPISHSPEPFLESHTFEAKPEAHPSPAFMEVSKPDPAPLLIPELAPPPQAEPPKLEPAFAAPLKPEPAPLPKVEPVTKVEPAPKVEPPPKVEPKPEPAPASAPPKTPVAHVIEAEVIFCQMGLDAWFDPQRLHPQVESLIYWRDVPRSGAALGAGMALLVALACCSVVSVLAYSALLLLTAAVAFRVYKNVLQAVQKTNEGHPFKSLLEKDLSLPAERAQSLAAAATAHTNAAINELRRLFLVEDLVDSLKFGVLLWCLTYVGACFNGITLIILGWIALFTLPKAYEMNKSQVDANLEMARAKINEITAKVRAAVPLGRKSESEKDK